MDKLASKFRLQILAFSILLFLINDLILSNISALRWLVERPSLILGINPLSWLAPLIFSEANLIIFVTGMILMLILILASQMRKAKAILYFYLGISTIALIFNVMALFLSLWNPAATVLTYFSDTILIWIANTLIFTCWYYLIDRPRQELAKENQQVQTYFIFTTNELEEEAWLDWKPKFFDYLFLSFQVSTIFNTAQTSINGIKPKVLIMVQVLISLITILLILSRAVSLI